MNTTSCRTDVNSIQVGVAVSVTLIAGLFQLAMRVCQLGIICTFMSMPFIVAFLTASATQIIVAQVNTSLKINRSQSVRIFRVLASKELTR